MMEKKDRNLNIFFFSAIALSVLASFLNFVVFKNYPVEFESECDPAAESCFIYECDPEEDEECVVGEEKSYYKIIKKKARLVDKCGEDGQPDCFQIGCNPGEKCEEILCEEALLEEGQSCSDPETYLKEQAELELLESEEEADGEALEEDESESEAEVGNGSLETPGDFEESPGEAD